MFRTRAPFPLALPLALAALAAASATEALASVNVSVRLGRAAGCDVPEQRLWTPVTLQNPLSERLVIDIENGRRVTVRTG